MDKDRGTAGKADSKPLGHRKKISISQQTPGLWRAIEEDE